MYSIYLSICNPVCLYDFILCFSTPFHFIPLHLSFLFFISLVLFYVSDTSHKKKAGEHCEDLSFKTTVMFSTLPISSSLSPQGSHSVCSLTLSFRFPLKCFRNISYSLTIHSQEAACYIRSFINMSHRFYSWSDICSAELWWLYVVWSNCCLVLTVTLALR